MTYSLSDSNEFTVPCNAITDKPTIVNLTNHNFWNMAGLSAGRSIEGQILTLHASRYTPVSKVLIPHGQAGGCVRQPLRFPQAQCHRRQGARCA